MKIHGKKLFIQLQDVTFQPESKNIPRYLLNDPKYNGGASPQYHFKPGHEEDAKVYGWMARRWDPAVQERLYKLFDALGREFDGKIEGINLAETAFDVGESGKLFPPGFTYTGYRDAIIANMQALKKAFPRSVVIEYANFMPGEYRPVKEDDHGYLEAVYRAARNSKVGVGGPDLRPFHKPHMGSNYDLIREASHYIPVGIAVQDGDYVYPDPKTGKQLTIEQMVKFAKDYLRADYVFWCTEEPYFSRDLVPYLKGK